MEIWTSGPTAGHITVFASYPAGVYSYTIRAEGWVRTFSWQVSTGKIHGSVLAKKMKDIETHAVFAAKRDGDHTWRPMERYVYKNGHIGWKAVRR